MYTSSWRIWFIWVFCLFLCCPLFSWAWLCTDWYTWKGHNTTPCARLFLWKFCTVMQMKADGFLWKIRGRSVSAIHETFAGQKKYIKKGKQGVSPNDSYWFYVSTDQPERAVNNLLVCKDNLNFLKAFDSTSSYFALSKYWFEYFQKRGKNCPWRKKKTRVVELWWKGWRIQLGRLRKGWKGLDKGDIAKFREGPGVNGIILGTWLRTCMSRLKRRMQPKS